MTRLSQRLRSPFDNLMAWSATARLFVSCSMGVGALFFGVLCLELCAPDSEASDPGRGPPPASYCH